jgi:hypothetical protein
MTNVKAQLRYWRRIKLGGFGKYQSHI